MNQRTIRRMVLCGLIGFFLVANFVVTWLLWQTSYSRAVETIAFFLVGCLVAEICLLATWGALGSQKAKYRIPLTVVLGLVAVCVYLATIRLCGDSLPLDIILVMLGIAVAVYGCSLVPMWMMRWLTQRRIAVLGEVREPVGEGSAQFSLRYLLVSPVVLAGVMILPQYVLPKESEWEGGMAEVMFGAVVMVVFTTLICIPCVWFALGERRRWPWGLWLAVVCIGGPLLILGLFNAVYGSIGDIWEALRTISAFTFGVVTTLLAVLLIVRVLSYRLTRPGGGCPFMAGAAEAADPFLPSDSVD